MKVIFLDIDGVLNNDPQLEAAGRYDVFDPDSINEFNRLLNVTGAKIVVSSTWRYVNDERSFNERFMLAGIVPDRVIGLTPRTTVDHRGVEIYWWLLDHPDVTEYAVVDDDTDMHPLPSDRIVHTSAAVGLRAEHVDRLIKILGADAPQKEV